jgi:peptide/nickel transport system ATP-binding protein
VALCGVIDDGSLHAPTAETLDLRARLQRELGVAYLFITHDFGVVEYLAHDVAVMRAGRIVEAGPAEEVLARPQHEYTKTLLAAVPRLARAV